MGTIKNENGVADDVSEKEAKIIKQIEYYFSDINLGKDKFMQQEMMKNNGWIPLTVLLTFNRLKAITESEEDIVTALRKSKSGLILISENERQIKRDVERIPLPEMTEEYRKQLNLRTVHLKGFPSDAQYDDILGYCSQFGDVESLEVRRTKEKKFKGCVFAVYKTVEEAEKAVASDEKFNGNGLLRENKLRYFERKSEFFAKREQKKKAQKQANEAIESKFVANAVLKLKNVPKNIGFAKLKDELSKYGEIGYVDIDEETSQAFARFSGENEAQKALNKMSEKGSECQAVELKLDESVMNVELLSGDEEQSFWQKISKIRHEKKGQKEKGKKKKGRRNAGLKFHKRGQKRSGEDTNEVSSKQMKVEDTNEVSSKKIKVEDTNEVPLKQIKVEEQ